MNRQPRLFCITRKQTKTSYSGMTIRFMLRHRSLSFVTMGRSVDAIIHTTSLSHATPFVGAYFHPRLCSRSFPTKNQLRIRHYSRRSIRLHVKNSMSTSFLERVWLSRATSNEGPSRLFLCCTVLWSVATLKNICILAICFLTGAARTIHNERNVKFERTFSYGISILSRNKLQWSVPSTSLVVYCPGSPR